MPLLPTQDCVETEDDAKSGYLIAKVPIRLMRPLRLFKIAMLFRIVRVFKVMDKQVRPPSGPPALQH